VGEREGYVGNPFNSLRRFSDEHLATSTIWEWVEAEGLKWRRQEGWFHEAEIHDDRFAEKRGL